MTDDSTMPPPPPPEQPSQPQGQQPSGSNDNTMATVAHATVVTGFLIPLIVWLIGKDQNPFVDAEGKKALNFSILITIAYVVSAVLGVIPFIGWLLGTLIWLAAVAVGLIFGIQGAVAANKGQPYKYPFTIDLVK
ncbi:DUF4870 domain-containing protein [Demequina sp. NBRC 110053]|uniref:DUF4870 domain-containing protein n=1 Tax=Demequina sp. NBRC 110053 TaxID=1570342 RepID=UPI000A01E913|nr:DUF4870 domain-containing protein [Demequina sp. NBRC 110053]